MQAYKLKGAIDESGNLIVSEPIKMAPGEVEIIVLQTVGTVDNEASPKIESANDTAKRQPRTQIKALQDWFEKTQPAPPDFDPEQARWEALKEKYNL
ncbi:MAG: hypothetical protein WBV73_20495 [Phormidium sp.]